MKTVISWIRDRDQIVEPSVQNLHFQTDAKQKTCLGGFASLGVTLYVLYMAITKGMQMLELTDPYITSLEETMDYEEVGKRPLSTQAVVLFEILEGSDSTVDLDAENYKQYLHIRLRNVIKTYDGIEETKEENVYPVRKCREDDFLGSEYERGYWKTVKNVRHQYCIDDPNDEVFMQGTRDSQYDHQDHSYIIYEVWKCSEETKLEGDPDCAGPEEIDAWIDAKAATFKVINTKIDFHSFKEVATRQNEAFVPIIPLQAGAYSDTGNRFRYNAFLRTDHWLIQGTKLDPFYDQKFYNSDTYKVDPTQTLLAELYFRFDVDQITHTRVVLGFMDFIGTLGGVSGILLQILGWVLGGYAAYNSAFYMMAGLYRVRGQEGLFEVSKQNSPSRPNMVKMKLKFWDRFKIYLFKDWVFAPLLSCLRTERIASIISVMEKGEERMENEMDMSTMINNIRKMEAQLELLKAQAKVKGLQVEEGDEVKEPKDNSIEIIESSVPEEKSALNSINPGLVDESEAQPIVRLENTPIS